MTTSLTVQTSYHVVGTALQRRRALLKAVIYDKDEASVKGNATNAGDVIKSLRFSSYEENSLCDLKEGIPGDKFDATVEEIAELTNMPIKVKRVVTLSLFSVYCCQGMFGLLAHQTLVATGKFTT